MFLTTPGLPHVNMRRLYLLSFAPRIHMEEDCVVLYCAVLCLGWGLSQSHPTQNSDMRSESVVSVGELSTVGGAEMWVGAS